MVLIFWIWNDRDCVFLICGFSPVPHKHIGSGTNNASILLHKNLLLQNYKHVIHNNITLKHTLWQFRWNVQIKTINHYTHFITLPTTLTQALLLLDSAGARQVELEPYTRFTHWHQVISLSFTSVLKKRLKATDKIGGNKAAKKMIHSQDMIQSKQSVEYLLIKYCMLFIFVSSTLFPVHYGQDKYVGNLFIDLFSLILMWSRHGAGERAAVSNMEQVWYGFCLIWWT